MATEFIEIPDFDFSAFYYPDFVRSLTLFARQNVPEITDESDEEPFTQLIRAFALVGHLNNVLLDVVATETLLPTARLLESVRSHLRLIDVILEQAKPSATDIVFELSALFTTPVNFAPQGTAVATEETDDSPQITFEADTDNVIQPTNVPGAVFSFDPGFVQFLSNVFHGGDQITVAGVTFTPGVDFSIGADLDTTVNNFVDAFNASSSAAIEGQLFAFKVNQTAFITFLNDDLVSVAVSSIDNTLETTLVDQSATGTDAPLDTATERRGDDFTLSFNRTIKSVTYSLRRTGIVTGNVRCVIETDDSGTPSGTVVATSDPINISALSASYADEVFTFASTTNLTAGAKYWFILEYDSPVGLNTPAAEVTDIQFVDGVNLATAEVVDIQFNNAADPFFDVDGPAKYWLLDAEDGSEYYVWYNVTNGDNVQTDGLQEKTDVDFTGQSGATYDVNGNGLYFTINSPTPTSYYVWFNVTDGGFTQTDPAPGGTAIQVDILTADADTVIAEKCADAIDLFAELQAVDTGAVCNITNRDAGDSVDSADGTTGATVTKVQDGTSTLVPGRTSVEVELLKSDGVFQIAQRTASAITALSDFSAVIEGSDKTRITQANTGTVPDPVDNDAGIIVTVITSGSNETNDYDVNGNGLHWLLNAQSGTDYYVWYNVTDGDFVQTDPSVGGRTGLQVDILKADTPNNIASKTQAVIDVVGDFTATVSTDTVQVTDANTGDVTDATDVDANVNITLITDGTNDSRVIMDSSGAGDSRYFTGGLWTSPATSLRMLIIADSTNFVTRSGGFGIDRSGEASLPGATFSFSPLDVVPGTLFYIMHESIMWDAVELTFDTIGQGIDGVWEFYDGDIEDTLPVSVTNLGQNLEIDVTSLVGELDRTGALVTVTFTGTGVNEVRPVVFEGGKNLVRTSLLGQVAVSTDANEYIVGSNWNEVSQLNDGIQSFTQDGTVGYTLPQSLSQNWTTKTINTFEGFPLRFRVVNVDPVVQKPIIDTVDITAGAQYLLFAGTQGETKVEDPLGSSDGSANQQFTLQFSPLIVESLSIEIDEGTGFSEWNRKDNFLTSTQISKDYTLEVTADDIATITFGDGQNGKIPAGGVDNIRATYRVFGGGAANDGNVGSNTVTINKSGIAFVNRVFNPRPATGFQAKEGSTQEDLARLKIAGPASLRVRNRAITPDDFEFLATEFTTATGASLVSRALAIEETFGIKTVELVVVGSGGSLLTQTQLDNLSKFFNGSKPDNIKGVGLTNHEVTAVNYTPRVINITAEVTGGNKAQIENALKSLLNPEALFDDGVTFRWDFDDNVPLAIIIAEIIAVDAQNIKNVNLTSPVADIDLAAKELPLAGTINITVL